MSKYLLLHTAHLTSIHLRASVSSFLSPKTTPSSVVSISTSRPLYDSLDLHRSFSIKAFDTKNDNARAAEAEIDGENGDLKGIVSDYNDDKYPSGEFQFRDYRAWQSFVVKCKMLFAFPWERVRKGSVLTMKLRGQVYSLNFFLFSKFIQK